MHNILQCDIIYSTHIYDDDDDDDEYKLGLINRMYIQCSHWMFFMSPVEINGLMCRDVIPVPDKNKQAQK